jgi:hypothetical protein
LRRDMLALLSVCDLLVESWAETPVPPPLCYIAGE